MKKNTDQKEGARLSGKSGRGRPKLAPEQREEMRDKIAAVAKKMFMEEGFRVVSMRKLASEIGCAPMTLYQYYENKLSILQTLWVHVFAELEQLLEESQTVTEPGNRLRLLMKAYVSYWIDRPEHYRLVFMTEGVSQSDVNVFLDAPQVKKMFGLFGAVLQQLNPTADEHRIGLHLDFLLSTMQGVIHNRITISGYPWCDEEEVLEFAVDRLSQ